MKISALVNEARHTSWFRFETERRYALFRVGSQPFVEATLYYSSRRKIRKIQSPYLGLGTNSKICITLILHAHLAFAPPLPVLRSNWYCIFD